MADRKTSRGTSARSGRKRRHKRVVPTAGAPKQLLLPWRQELTSQDLLAMRLAARGLVGRHGYTRSDVEDIVQDLALHVLERMGKYDPGRGAWSTFLTRLIRNKVVHLIEYRTYQKRDYRKCVPLLP